MKSAKNIKNISKCFMFCYLEKKRVLYVILARRKIRIRRVYKPLVGLRLNAL